MKVKFYVCKLTNLPCIGIIDITEDCPHLGGVETREIHELLRTTCPLGLDTPEANPVEVVVTRHPGLVEVLRELGRVGRDCEVISHATPKKVRGRHVAGMLPLSLAAECASITEVSLNLPPEARGKELSADEIRQYMISVRRYRVEVLP